MGGFPKLGGPYWGPYYKGVLQVWGDSKGSPCFRKPPNVLPADAVAAPFEVRRPAAPPFRV